MEVYNGGWCIRRTIPISTDEQVVYYRKGENRVGFKWTKDVEEARIYSRMINAQIAIGLLKKSGAIEKCDKISIVLVGDKK